MQALVSMSRVFYHHIPTAIHKALVLSVKEVESSHEFGKDTWFRFCHLFAPKNGQHFSVSWDPATYSIAFLGDFLRYVSEACQDDTVIREFNSRKRQKVDRGPGYVIPPGVREVDNLWIVVGESVLHGVSSSLLMDHCREVSLQSNYVHHSGSSVAMLLGCLTSGLVEQCVGIKLSKSYTISCIHFEGGLEDFPSSSNQAAFHGRLDNINNVLRAFGVDAKATSSALGYSVRSNLHPRLLHFVGVGVAGKGDQPCFHISPNPFLNTMCARGTKVLHDRLLVEMLHGATCGSFNGIETWYADRRSCVLSDVVRHYRDPSQSSALCLVLSPSGVPLQPAASSSRRDLNNIFLF